MPSSTPTTATRAIIVGLTGSIGMGKSTASTWLRRAGFPVHDADAAVHSLYAPGGAAVQPVSDAFPGTLSPEGGIDRAALSSALLTSGRETSLKRLEELVHPLVTADREAFVAKASAEGAWCVVLDVPLLMETMDADKRATLLDALIVVSAPAEVQRVRVMARPGMTAEKLDAILKRQVPDEVKRAAADFVIETGHETLAPARAQLARCMQTLAERHAAAYGRWRGAPLQPARGTSVASMLRVRAVSMDLDDTLWPTMPPILAASARLDQDIAELLPRAAAAGAAERSTLRSAVEQAGRAQPLLAHDMTELRRAALASIGAAHGDDVDAPSAPVDELMRRFVLARSDVAPYMYEDVAPCVAALRGAGLAVGSLTNGNCDVRLHAAVSALFDFAVCASDAGAAKPHPAPYWMAAAEAGYHPAEMVHVGDDVQTDLCGALAAGNRAVLLTRAERQRTADELAALPPADPSRWVEVATLEQAADAILAWDAS